MASVRPKRERWRARPGVRAPARAAWRECRGSPFLDRYSGAVYAAAGRSGWSGRFHRAAPTVGIPFWGCRTMRAGPDLRHALPDEDLPKEAEETC